MNELISQLEPMLEDDILLNTLFVLPKLQTNLRSKSERLIALNDVYKIFIPNMATVDVYNRLYLSLYDSLERKNTIDEVRLFNNNFLKRSGIIGGLDSYRITGNSGVGKTSAVLRCVDVISNNKIFKIKNSNRVIIPFLFIECPADGSFKSLLYSIMGRIDEIIGSTYFQNNKNKGMTTDLLLNCVSTILINHVGVLIIDEIERVAKENIKGRTLIDYLTQLVNQTNISICFVGDKSSNNYFSREEYLGRRTIGIDVDPMSYNEEFFNFCKTLFKYQYTNKKIELNSELLRTLFNYSNGIPSMVVSLFIETQKEIISKDKDFITSNEIIGVFNKLFSNVKPFIEAKVVRYDRPRGELLNKKSKNGSNYTLFGDGLRLSGKDLGRFISIIKDQVVIDYLEL